MVKLRYAAALALLDWYLMTAPPPQAGAPGNAQSVKAEVKAPLSRWTIVGIYTTQKDCEAHRATSAAQRCMAANDPRFRENNPPP